MSALAAIPLATRVRLAITQDGEHAARAEFGDGPVDRFLSNFDEFAPQAAGVPQAPAAAPSCPRCGSTPRPGRTLCEPCSERVADLRADGGWEDDGR